MGILVIMKQMAATCPWYFFDATAPDKIKPARRAEGDALTDEGNRLLCRFCLHPITDDNQKTTQQGQFLHCRTNPSGFTFEFGCYATAPGCSTRGEATIEHTWFPGYSWKLALCRNCGEHLGWLFTGDALFYGLIQDRLVSEE